mgnify:CR=1 FL=1
MKYEIFLRLIMTYKKAEDNTKEWYDFGIDLHEGKYPIAPYLYDMMIACFESSYNKNGVDWISWFIFENEYGNKVWGTTEEADGFGAHDEDGNPIAYSYESLWIFLEAEYKNK